MGSFGCNGGGDSATRPTVVSTYPQNESENIPIFTSPTVTFSEAMDESSITNETLTLAAGDVTISIGVSYDSVTKKATITYADDLSYSTEYTVTVSNLVMDSAGNTMTESYVFTFTTSEQEPGTISWMNPLPQGNDLLGVWSISANDIFAVGYNGTILRSDGTNWSLMESNTSSNLYAVWGLSSSNVYAVGSSGVIMHYDGSEWSLAHMDPDGETFLSIWGSSATDIHIGGQGGKIIHWNGTDWRIKQSGSNSNIGAMWGFSNEEVYAADWTSRVLKYNPPTWYTMQQFDDANYMFNALWGTSGNNLYVAGVPFEGDCQMFHFDGDDWDCIDEIWERVASIWGSAADDIFAVGNAGVIYYFDGTSWDDTGFNYIFYSGVSGSDSNDVYAVGSYGSLNHYNGSKWSVQSGTLIWGLAGIWGTDTDNLYAVGQAGAILYYDGTSWEPADSPISYDLVSIDGNAANNIYAVGRSDDEAGYIIKYNGTSWEIDGSYSDCTMMGVWVANDDKVFATAQDNVYRFDGADWQTDLDVSPEEAIHAISGSSSTNVIVVGNDGFAKRFNGTSWETLSTGTTERFESLIVFSETEAYAGDDKGNLYLFDGTSWTIQGNPLGTIINALWGTSGENLYMIVGKNSESRSETESILYHYDGTNFSQIDNLSHSDLIGVWGLSENDIYYTGQNGAILHFEQ